MDKIEETLKEGFACITSICNMLGEEPEMDKELKSIEDKVINGDYDNEFLKDEIEWLTKK